jgi:hypothetical protein
MDNVEFAFATKDFEIPAGSVGTAQLSPLVGALNTAPLLTASLFFALAVHVYRILVNESDLTDVTP